MSRTESFFRYCFIVFATLVIGAKCVFLFNILPPIIAVAGTVGIILLCLAALVYWQRVYDFISRRLRWFNALSYRQMLVIIAAVSLTTKLLAIALFQIESLNDGSDISVYVSAAYELGTVGRIISSPGYLYSFSHMFWFAAFLSPVAGAFGISQNAFSIYLTAVMTVSSLLLFAAFAQQAGKNKAFTVLVLYNLLPGTILLPQYITHEIAMLFLRV